MKESCAQQDAQRPEPSTGSRHAGHSCGSATPSVRSKAERNARPTRAIRPGPLPASCVSISMPTDASPAGSRSQFLSRFAALHCKLQFSYNAGQWDSFAFQFWLGFSLVRFVSLGFGSVCFVLSVLGLVRFGSFCRFLRGIGSTGAQHFEIPDRRLALGSRAPFIAFEGGKSPDRLRRGLGECLGIKRLARPADTHQIELRSSNAESAGQCGRPAAFLHKRMGEMCNGRLGIRLAIPRLGQPVTARVAGGSLLPGRGPRARALLAVLGHPLLSQKRLRALLFSALPAQMRLPAVVRGPLLFLPFCAACAFPATVFGPVLLRALARLAASFAKLTIIFARKELSA